MTAAKANKEELTDNVVSLEKEVVELPTTEEDTTEEVVPTVSSLFSDTSKVQAGGANQIVWTAQLTAKATDIYEIVWTHLMSLTPEEVEAEWKDLIKASQEDHGHMDDLIERIYPLDTEDLTFLKDVSKADFERMIRSQQSKRSRAKGAAEMNQETYKSMMVGAISENLLRLAAGMPKSSSTTLVDGEIAYTEERIAEFMADAEKLKKEIRNVQSKKSIEQNKKNHSVTSVRWISLLKSEAFLKQLRDNAVASVPVETTAALEAKAQATELLKDVDTASLSPEEQANLLDKVKEILASK